MKRKVRCTLGLFYCDHIYSNLYCAYLFVKNSPIIFNDMISNSMYDLEQIQDYWYEKIVEESETKTNMVYKKMCNEVLRFTLKAI